MSGHLLLRSYADRPAAHCGPARRVPHAIRRPPEAAPLPTPTGRAPAMSHRKAAVRCRPRGDRRRRREVVARAPASLDARLPRPAATTTPRPRPPRDPPPRFRVAAAEGAVPTARGSRASGIGGGATDLASADRGACHSVIVIFLCVWE